MDTIRICKECRKPLPANAPEGLCPECLARVALGSEPAAKSDSTLTISPDAFVRVRYFGDYELQEEIARGGMGVVWKARQASLNRTVALKMILAGKLAGEAEVRRFRREAEAAANLQHPNIVAIHEVGEHEGQHYYSMDFIAGRDLGAVVRESGPFPPAQAAQFLKTIAEAVHFAHQRGTLHRDLKPQNVLLDAAGIPRITDFGLAKFVERDDSLTATGATMGSPSYMPPEQAAGHLDQIGPHSDVYALGAILYELLTARPPFRAETPVATMRLVMESDPVAPRKLNPDVPPDLETICLKCLEKNPTNRYHSAQALADELDRFLKHEPIQAVPAGAVRKAETWLRRHPWSLMAAVSLLAVVLLGLLDWQYERVRFLEFRSLPTGPSKPMPDPGAQQFDEWEKVIFRVGVPATLFWTLIILRQYGRGNPSLFKVPADWKPARPVSRRMRTTCGMIGVATFGFTVFCFAKLIHDSVWGRTANLTEWGGIYANFYLSLMLLARVFRDYQKAVHGTPSTILPAEQDAALRRLINDGETIAAIKLVRKTFPETSLAEARAYVVQFATHIADAARIEWYRTRFPGASMEEAREKSAAQWAEHVAEVKAKNPGLFGEAKPWDLHWPLLGLSLLLEAVALAVFRLAFRHVADSFEMWVFSAAFLGGAGVLISARVKNKWTRSLCLALCILLPAILFSWRGHAGSFGNGWMFGTIAILSGYTPKRQKPVSNKDFSPVKS